MSHHPAEILLCGETRPVARTDACSFIQRALTTALKVACEAAVMPKWFEIDEQGPLSRIDALAEELVRQLRNEMIEPNDLAQREEAVSIIEHVTRRIRASVA
jgi:hypothetical protein